MLEEEEDDKGFYEEHFGSEIFEEGNDSEFTSEGEGGSWPPAEGRRAAFGKRISRDFVTPSLPASLCTLSLF